MKVAVITGAASGIGLALTQVHLKQDIMVVMVDKNKAKLHDEAEQLKTDFPNKVFAIYCDVSKKKEVVQLAEQIEKEFKRVDWIYNNAGIIGQLAPVWNLNSEHVHQVFSVNLYGLLHMIQAFMPFLFKQNRRAHIINMASLYALCAGSRTAAYSMSKHAVLALSESLYFDLAQLNKPVDVSVVFPSFTDTGLLSNNLEDNSSFHGVLQSLLSHSRPAIDLAEHIIQEVEQKKFYIFPDKEVKGYCEDRTQALLLQKDPHATNIEKLINALIQRQAKK
jgi:NAD(P)-dependent dehydrogenase (short-subunit alcohol dehydrogenase family)